MPCTIARKTRNSTPASRPHRRGHTPTKETTMIYTECLLTISTAYMDYCIAHGGLNLALWNALILQGYRR